MIESVRSIEGDTVELIAWRHYGTGAGTTEAVLEANPGLASAGAVLIPGTLVMLPEISVQVRDVPTVRLWD